MNASSALIVILITYFLAYRFYAGFIAKKIFDLNDKNQTPAFKYTDGIDYVPTKKAILFGHHYASIAGLSPMLGPAVAVIWGVIPALFWVVAGAIFMGCVHDFGALFLSVRHQGKSVGAVAESIIGPRAKNLMHGIIFFLVSLGMGVFVYVIAFLFSPPPHAAVSVAHYPQAVIPSFGLMIVAVAMALVQKIFKVRWSVLAAVGFLCLLLLLAASINSDLVNVLGLADQATALSLEGYSALLLVYAFVAAVLPVWLLLQPRDFLNSLLLYLGMGLVVLAIIVSAPQFSAPAFRLNPPGAPPLFPFVFLVLACGSISGFHALVASGTTAKQLSKESDARLIGYGGMMGESLLGVIAVLATTSGTFSSDGWIARYQSWESVQGLGPQISGFIMGSAHFLSQIGIDLSYGAALMSVIVVSFALTSLDSATRLLRYNVEEIAESLNISWLKNRYVASLLAVSSIAFFAFFRVGGKPAGLMLWALFGTTNQILAGLTLLIIGVFVARLKKKSWPFFVPMAFVLSTTILAMIMNLKSFYDKGQASLVLLGTILLVMALWLLVEALRLIFVKRPSSQQVSA